MAADSNKNKPQSIFSGGIVNNDNNNGTGSRLLTDSKNIRNALSSRNLYTPNLEYPNTNSNTATKIVNAVSGLLNVVQPFSSFDLKSSVFSRLAGDNTPITEIGSIMLAKQFAYNAKSHISQQNLPTIKLSNLFDGSKDTKLFTKNINLKITDVKATTFTDKFNNLLDKVVFNVNSSNEYPFSSSSTNDDYLKATGSGQLNFLFQLLNNNLYKSDSPVLIDIGDNNKTPIKTRNNIVNIQSGAIINTSYKPFFNFSNATENPYIFFNASFFDEIPANQEMAMSYLAKDNIQEYAPNKDYIINNLGTVKQHETFTLNTQDRNAWIPTNSDSNENDINNQIIWGKSGISNEVNENLTQLRGDTDQVDNNYSDIVNNFDYGKFNIKSGLLEYTRNLINATGGRVGDITKKAFVDDDKNVVGFNGSPLWQANDSLYAIAMGTDNKTGVRQHSILDQYDRYSKAIRFDGNIVYGGNENSVISKSVMPRIHPTLSKNGVVDNKNLMFSIENLALRVISKGDVGIIDDEYGSEIPICEVGPFNGRIMWFPPYNLNFSETHIAKYESTVMVGRSEPIYTYMNSERTGTLSFSLLMDYPHHLKQFHNTNNNQKEVSEFFTFGGDPYTPSYPVDNPQEKIQQLEDEINNIKNGKTEEDPDVTPPPEMKIAFPNAVPRVEDNLNSIIDAIYLDNTYEIIDGLASVDGTSFGLNKEIFIPEGVVDGSQIGTYILNKSLLPPSFTQYDQAGDCVLNNKLKDFFGNENNRKLFKIIIYGRASKLGGENYNKELGLRRADATIAFLKRRLSAIFEKSFEDLNITIEYTKDGSIGESGGVDIGETSEGIQKRDVKLDRVAYIGFARNNVVIEDKPTQTSQDDLNTIKEKRREIENLYNEYLKKGKVSDCVFNEKTKRTKTWNGFASITENQFNPFFHSQTPEDFHKRLTFMSQCTRQGSAKRYDIPDKNGNAISRNSVFGRQPICILRVGDFYYSKIIIESVTIDYQDSPWDMNPEGFGMQPMIANLTLQIKFIGGQSLDGPIDAIQNASDFNYYANSNYIGSGMYKKPSKIAQDQKSFISGVLEQEIKKLTEAYKQKFPNK